MPKQTVKIATRDGVQHEVAIDGNFTTIVKYLNQAKEGKFEPLDDLGGHFATVLKADQNRLVLNPDEVAWIEEDRSSVQKD